MATRGKRLELSRSEEEFQQAVICRMFALQFLDGDRARQIAEMIKEEKKHARIAITLGITVDDVSEMAHGIYHDIDAISLRSLSALKFDKDTLEMPGRKPPRSGTEEHYLRHKYFTHWGARELLAIGSTVAQLNSRMKGVTDDFIRLHSLVRMIAYLSLYGDRIGISPSIESAIDINVAESRLKRAGLKRLASSKSVIYRSLAHFRPTAHISYALGYLNKSPSDLLRTLSEEDFIHVCELSRRARYFLGRWRPRNVGVKNPFEQFSMHIPQQDRLPLGSDPASWEYPESMDDIEVEAVVSVVKDRYSADKALEIGRLLSSECRDFAMPNLPDTKRSRRVKIAFAK